MSHLDVNTIIEYVMINEINDETKALASRVCSHLKECEKCRDLVNAYMDVYEALVEEAGNRITMGEREKTIMHELVAAQKEQAEIYATEL